MENIVEQNIANTRAQMRKGILEFCTLLVLSKKPMYSTDILTALKHADLLVVEGTLYPLLNRLKRSELLQYEWKESPTGPPRKYYSLTKEGKHTLTELTTTWQSLSKTLTTLMQ